MEDNHLSADRIVDSYLLSLKGNFLKQYLEYIS